MWAIDEDPEDPASFPEGDAYTYAGAYTPENTCQERRPGALHTWSLTTTPLMGKIAGADLKDCGGLCCDPNFPNCTQGLYDDEHFGISGIREIDGEWVIYSASDDYPWNTTLNIENGLDFERDVDQQKLMGEHCKANRIACACPCYGKKEGEYVYFVPPSPPPSAPPSTPPSAPLVPFCPMAYEYIDKYLVDDATAGSAADFGLWGDDFDIPEVPGTPYYGSNSKGSGGVDHQYFANREHEGFNSSMEDFTALCCEKCKAFNEGVGHWCSDETCTDRGMRNCTTFQVHSSVEYRFVCKFFDLSADINSLKTPSSIDQSVGWYYAVNVWSNVNISQTSASDTQQQQQQQQDPIVRSSGNLPPAAPIAACAQTAPHTDVISSCSAKSTKVGSNCTNVYDDVVGGYNSITTMGGDLARSWVADGVSNAEITIVFKEAVDINTLYLTQRLYHGLNNQVTSISIVVFDEADRQVEAVSGLQTPIAIAPMQALQHFVSTIRFVRTYGGVKRLRILIDGAQDSTDVGIEELSFGNVCADSLPSPPPPAATAAAVPPPGAPSSPFAVTAGAVTGQRVAASWHGSEGQIGLVPERRRTEDSNGDEIHTAAECAAHCGSFVGAEEYCFYNGTEPLPFAIAACECFEIGKWTILDGRSTSGFLHGKAVGSKTSAGSVPFFIPLNGFYSAVDGGIVPFPTHIAASSAFQLSVTIQPHALIGNELGNVLRVAPWRLKSECRPCIDASETKIRAVYYTGVAGGINSATMYKSATLTYAMTSSNTYTVVARLSERRLFVYLFLGDNVQGAPIAQISASMSLSGDFPPYERVCVYMGSVGAGNIGIANVNVDPRSVTYDGTLSSHKHLDFKFDDQGDFLRNTAKFGIGFDGPPLTQANSNALYATASPNTATRVAGRSTTNYAASFDLHSMLTLSTDLFVVDGIQNDGLTGCAWVNPTLARDTLFTTIFGCGDAFAMHYYAYFDDISVLVDGTETRALPHASANTELFTWAHFCVSFSTTGGHVRLYKDGQLVGSAVSTLDTFGCSAPFSVGGSTDLESQALTGNDRGFGGMIDDVAVWTRQLSDQEVLQVFES